MLKKIVIALSEKVKKKEINTFIKEMKRQASDWLEIEEIEVYDSVALLFGKNTLIITDEEKIYKRACQINLPVLIYFHDSDQYEDNQIPSFPSVLFGVLTLNEIEFLFLERVYQRYYNIPWNILETVRCGLREMTVKDLDELYEIYSEPSITAYMEDLYENRQEEEQYIKAYIQEHYRFYGYGMWIIFDKHTGCVIGRAGITNRDGFEEPELGYMISKQFQGKGYAYEVCNAILEYCKKELEIFVLNAFVDERNIESVHLLEKLGFVFKDNLLINEASLQRYQHVGK